MRIDNLYDEHDAPSGGSFEPLPPGEYRFRVLETERKDNSSGTGWYLKITMEVVNGDYKGRRLFDCMNLVHQNPQTVEIARKIFAAFRASVGCPAPKDSVELHGLEGVAKVKVVKRTDNGELTNKIQAYLPKGGADDRPQPKASPAKGGGGMSQVPW